jgi:hypothetical protein
MERKKKNVSNGTEHFKNVNNGLNTNIYSYLETSGSNFIKLFTAVIYRHSMVIPSFCVIKQH